MFNMHWKLSAQTCLKSKCSSIHCKAALLGTCLHACCLVCLLVNDDAGFPELQFIHQGYSGCEGQDPAAQAANQATNRMLMLPLSAHCMLMRIPLSSCKLLMHVFYLRSSCVHNAADSGHMGCQWQNSHHTTQRATELRQLLQLYMLLGRS